MARGPAVSLGHTIHPSPAEREVGWRRAGWRGCPAPLSQRWPSAPRERWMRVPGRLCPARAAGQRSLPPLLALAAARTARAASR